MELCLWRREEGEGGRRGRKRERKRKRKRERKEKKRGREEWKDHHLPSTMLTDCHLTYQSHLCACNGTTAVNAESSTGIGLSKFVLLLSIVHMGHPIPEDGDRTERREEGERKGGEKKEAFKVVLRPRLQRDTSLSSHHAL